MTEIKESENRFGTHNPRADRVVNCVCEFDVKSIKDRRTVEAKLLIEQYEFVDKMIRTLTIYCSTEKVELLTSLTINFLENVIRHNEGIK